MQYLALSLLACIAAASARFLPENPYGVNPYPYIPPIPQPGFNPGMSTGGGYVDQGYSRGSGGSSGSAYQGQGSNSFYNQGHHHNRVKQVLERENSGGHNFGGTNQGSYGGQSGGTFNTFDTGRLNSGSGFSNTGFYV